MRIMRGGSRTVSSIAIFSSARHIAASSVSWVTSTTGTVPPGARPHPLPVVVSPRSRAFHTGYAREKAPREAGHSMRCQPSGPQVQLNGQAVGRPSDRLTPCQLWAVRSALSTQEKAPPERDSRGGAKVCIQPSGPCCMGRDQASRTPRRASTRIKGCMWCSGSNALGQGPPIWPRSSSFPR